MHVHQKLSTLSRNFSDVQYDWEMQGKVRQSSQGLALIRC